MELEKKDTTGKKKFAFRDVRSAALLLASARLVKSIKFKTLNPISKKLSSFTNILTGTTSKILKSKVTSAATKAALGAAAGIFAAKLAGKVKLPSGQKIKAVSKIASMTTQLGVQIIEETDPEKIRRPLKEGLSASASAMGKSLAETVAASTAQSLRSGVSLATAISAPARQFKTAASLVHSPRFFNPQNESYEVDMEHRVAAERAVKHVTISTPASRLYPQRGLLEDELMHRLTLLAENVYAPVNAYVTSRGWKPLRILEGFLPENSGTSSHEVGEALDITLGGGDLTHSANCFALAQWMRDHIQYDQLILCFDVSGGGQVWIHVSFRFDNRRREVWTKPFNDVHVEGLHLYELALPTVEETSLQHAGVQFGAMLASRQQRLDPVGLDTVRPQEVASGVSFGNDPIIETISYAATEPLIWAWQDLGGPEVTGGTFESYRAEFFATINKSLWESADDWSSVLSSSGYPTNPAIGQTFTGIYLHADSSGRIQRRVFLPTATPNSDGYYFHTIDVLASIYSPHPVTANVETNSITLLSSSIVV